VTPTPSAAPAESAAASPPPVTIVVTGSPRPKPKPPAPLPLPNLNMAYPNFKTTIVYTIAPTDRCATCQMVRITVSPTGEVLIERGNWDAAGLKWRYRGATSRVKRNTANAFAAALEVERPVGEKSRVVTGLACDMPIRDDSLTIEWIEFGRKDRLTVKLDCTVQGDSRTVERLRRMPNILGLPTIAVP